jgi:hypothetical protein
MHGTVSVNLRDQKHLTINLADQYTKEEKKELKIITEMVMVISM